MSEAISSKAYGIPGYLFNLNVRTVHHVKLSAASDTHLESCLDAGHLQPVRVHNPLVAHWSSPDICTNARGSPANDDARSGEKSGFTGAQLTYSERTRDGHCQPVGRSATWQTIHTCHLQQHFLHRDWRVSERQQPVLLPDGQQPYGSQRSASIICLEVVGRAYRGYCGSLSDWLPESMLLDWPVSGCARRRVRRPWLPVGYRTCHPSRAQAVLFKGAYPFRCSIVVVLRVQIAYRTALS
jgi:hypothetical protein